ncbi:hypothetical protein Tsubulata_037372 [Turnera subulata]|uniref:UVR domain-containing protein n=1 Tax=Turnera subulata TaxID=218843 RepID=A0A9Q0FUK7_9ROSI|nr:hypothetical protein Tsubulata_037372 [Turnera subulata]
MDDEEMDSLFEGMVLFTTEQQHQEEEAEAEHEQQHHSPVPAPAPAPSSTTTTTTTTTRTSSNSNDIKTTESDDDHHHHHQRESSKMMQQEPLDENLFSDLTILTPPLQTLTIQSDAVPTNTVTNPPDPTTAATATTTSVFRQISRKKKRAAGLRIGYGRDTSSSSFDDQQPSPPPSPPPTSSPLSAVTPIIIPRKDEEDSNDSREGQEEEEAVLDLDSGSGSVISVTGRRDTDKDKDVSKDNKDEVVPPPSTSPSPSPSQSPSPAEEFQGIRKQISEILNRAREAVTSASLARKEAIRRRRKASEDLESASADYARLESELNDACEAEDFETAQRISDSIAASETLRLSLLNALKEAQANCDALDSQFHHALTSQIAAEQECASLLYNFVKDSQNNAHLVLNKAEAFSSQQLADWFSSAEDLEAKNIELDIESHFIDEARLVFNHSISRCIEDDTKEKELLCSKKHALTDELLRLLALVKEKEKEIADNDTKIRAVEDRIANVLSGFEETRSGIDSKHHNLQSSLSQMHLQSEALSTKREEIDRHHAQELERVAKLRELAMVAEEEAKSYQQVVDLRKSLQLSILKSQEDKVRLAKTEEKLTDDVQLLQQEVSAARASLQEMSSTKSGIQQNISSFKQRIFFIDKRIPELESEKKVAAAARNFKEAARIAAEAKSLGVEKDNLHIDMKKAISQLEELEDDIKDTFSRLHDIEGLILSKEKEVAMSRFQRLLLISGAVTAERLAALELGDTEEADLLLAEAEAANAEAKKLQSLYNFKEEEFADIPKHFISMELVSNLGQKQLAEFATGVDFPAPQ